jgi:hypothetical protein
LIQVAGEHDFNEVYLDGACPTRTASARATAVGRELDASGSGR